MKYNIVFGTDDNFMWLIPVVIRSILTHTPIHELSFHVLYSGKGGISKIEEHIKEFSDLDLSVYDVDVSNRKYLGGLGHVSIATMLRLFMVECMTEVSGRVLYLDLDVVVHTSLDWIYKVDLGPTGVMARSSIKRPLSHWGKKFKTSLRYENKKSFNAGVLVLDFDLLRKDDFTKEVLETWSSCPACNDQFILNLYCDGKYAELTWEYNIFNNYQVDRRRFNRDKKDPSYEYILHYAGTVKPWIEDMSMCGRNRRFFKKCPNGSCWTKFRTI